MALGDNQWVGAKFTHYANDANISYRGILPDAYNAGAKYNPAPDDYFLTERKSLDLNHQIDINADMSLNTLVYWSDMNRDYWRYGLVSGANTISDGQGGSKWNYSDSLSGNNRSFNRVGLDSRLTVAHNSFGFKNEAEIGVRLMQEEMIDQQINALRATPRTGTISTDRVDSATAYALFGQNQFDLSDLLSVTAGIRVEHYEQERDDLRDSSKNKETSNTEYLPGLGLTYQVSPAAQLYGSVYQAFSPPLNSQSLVSNEVLDLEAEKSVNFEIGVRGKTNKLAYELTAFQMDFDNQITPGIQNSTNANAGKTIHRGMEAAIAYAFGKGFSLDANLT
jgi:Fe(3+) dicitrate transport protein